MAAQHKVLISPKQRWNRTLSLITIALGTVLLVFMITVEDEFGALPLFLILGGIIWFLINQRQIRKRAMNADFI